jgi:excisionase family DNA binding protein
MLEEMYDIPAISTALKISPRTCRHLIKTGVLPTIRVGRLHRISKTALDSWVAAGGNKDRYRTPSTQVDVSASGQVAIAI